MSVIEFTELSGRNVSFILGEDKSPKQIIDFLSEEANIRTFGDVLKRVYPGEDLNRKIAQGLSEITGENAENIGRKVRNWVMGNNLPKSRDTLFQICFILGAKPEEASALLSFVDGNCIHYRNAKELIYTYSLRKGRSYEEAQELYQRMSDAGCFPLKRREKKPDRDNPAFTEQVRDAFESVNTDEELWDFFRENGEKLGEMHETAWRKFEEFLTDLKNPKNLLIEEPVYSYDQLMDYYISMGMPVTKQTNKFSLLQRVIKKYWPGSKNISGMERRKEDVSRKALILLAVITEMVESYQPEWDDEYIEEEELWQEEPDTRLMLQIQNMNLLLDECGMGRIDPCSPFDYLVLYALKDPEEEGMSERMKAVIEQLFAED